MHNFNSEEISLKYFLYNEPGASPLFAFSLQPNAWLAMRATCFAQEYAGFAIIPDTQD